MEFKIKTPTLLIDKKRCVENIRRMAVKAKESSIQLRPHCKTHCSLQVARWLKEEAGVNCITVSSLTMAKYFSVEWKDITVAFPVNILELETIQALLDDGVRLKLLVENIEAIEYLQHNLKGDSIIDFYVKIDVGYGRTGIPAENLEGIDTLLGQADDCDRTRFYGFLTHAGHTYHATSRDEIYRIHNTSKELLQGLKERYISRYPHLILSMGDTPSCSVVEAKFWQGIDEMRPGNFVFYDLEQAYVGSCNFENIAVVVACPIVAKHADRRELTLYGGGVHLSKDRLVQEDSKNEKRKTILYGRVVENSTNNNLEWGKVLDGFYIRSLSQEHGIAVVPANQDFESFKIGDIIKILPVHSCMTADVMKKGYITTSRELITRMRD